MAVAIAAAVTASATRAAAVMEAAAVMAAGVKRQCLQRYQIAVVEFNWQASFLYPALT